jgi:hypothetical protein
MEGVKMAENDASAPRDIHLLTTDALLAELVDGRAVAVGGGELLSLDSDNVRAVLDWYRRNRGKWSGNLTAGDAEEFVDVIGTSPPLMDASAADGHVRTNKILRLTKITAHRFAGLHAFGRPTEPPNAFTFEPHTSITLFEGGNGSGKTSIANAIVWCLTGHLIRAQRPPEEGPTEFECEVVRDDGSVSTHPMSSITPMPHATGDFRAEGEPILADTWVELTFVDGEGNQLPPIRREQGRTARHKITETPPDLDEIGVDPIAWRIATTMPALLPFLPVGTASQLGQAVARLTGLADLVDLARHATKASDRITKRMTKELETEIAGMGGRYTQAVDDLANAVAEHPDMAFEGEVPPVNAEDARERLVAIADHFACLKAAALAEARSVLGDGFDPEDKAARDDLEASIRPAIEQVSSHLEQLPAVARLTALSVDTDGIAATIELLDRIHVEAATLAELAANPDRARRAQLYARVSAWMHEHGHVDDGTCPVCIGPLQGACDPVTGNAIGDHLAEAARDREVVARTVTEWASHWCGRLLQELPPAIAAESRRDLPALPLDLLQSGLIDELFATAALKGTLSALRPDFSALLGERLAKMPKFDELAVRALPEALKTETAVLKAMIARAVRAMAFVEWRNSSDVALRDFLGSISRGVDEAADAERAIGRRLSSLLAIVEGVAPLNAAIEYVGRLNSARADHATKQVRVVACGQAAAALDLLVPLGDLAQTQVDILRAKLHNRSEYWRQKIYRNATELAPDLTGTGMDAKGVLEFKVGRQGVTAPAQHVSNASALRGALLGFFIAFREHVLSTRGGLELLILDDPQELLDNDNRERLARGLSLLAQEGAQLIATSCDRKFARSIVAENRAEGRVEHLSVHPVNAVRPTLVVAPAIEEVDRKRQAFHANPDSASHAQDYASDLRVFLESRLGDLFDEVAYPAYAASTKALTLISLMDKLRGLVSVGAGEIFTNPIVKRFAENTALAAGAEPRHVLNQAHHDKASITYMDVKAVDADFARLRTDIEKVHLQFRLHRWREPLAPSETGSAKVTSLQSMLRPVFSVPICPDIAAFVGQLSEGGSQDVPGDWLDGQWFEGKAIYYVRGDTLGFAIPSGSIAIVEADPYPGRDQNLVIALYRDQVLARRLVTSRGAIGVSLSAQMPDPRVRRPTLTFDESKVQMHRIVGAIFTEIPPPPGGGEAVLIGTAPELAEIAVAYRVKEESAIPLALPGQVILGGAKLNATDLDAWEGRLAAVTLEDGSSIFKRIGARLPDKLAFVRQFESIGGLGSSVVIATESIDSENPFPIMVSARRVVGVLYEGI